MTTHQALPDIEPPEAPAVATTTVDAGLGDTVEASAAHHAGHHAGHQAPPPEADDAPRRSWTVLTLALAAQILVVLDISVVNTALPTIGTALHLNGSDMQWVVTAYLMMSGGGLLLGGRIADLLNRKWVFLTGLAVFTVASLVSGLAGSATELIAARAGQGLAAALMTPSALSIIVTTYAGSQRRTGLALWGAVGSMGVAAGVLFGGALTTWAGWQTIFWINVPIGAIALLAGLKVLPAGATTRAALARFDLLGAFSVIGGLVALVFALGGTETHGWFSARTMVAFALSALLLASFGLVEARTPNPLIPPQTWKVRTLVSGTAVMLGVTGILVGAVFLTSIFVQTVLGYSALRTGVAFLPFALAITAGTFLARHALGHLSPRSIAAAGLLLVGVGGVLLSMASADSQFLTGVLPGMLIIGLGVGLVFVPVSVTAMADIPPHYSGMASGFLMTGHEVGAALGVAVLSAVASTAGSLASPSGVVNGFSRGFLAAAVIAGLFAVFAYLRMPATRMAGGAGAHMHH